MLTRVKVKVCGVRSIEEAEAALDAGADAIGFNFWPRSPRYIAPRAAADIIERIAVGDDHIRRFANIK